MYKHSYNQEELLNNQMKQKHLNFSSEIKLINNMKSSMEQNKITIKDLKMNYKNMIKKKLKEGCQKYINLLNNQNNKELNVIKIVVRIIKKNYK